MKSLADFAGIGREVMRHHPQFDPSEVRSGRLKRHWPRSDPRRGGVFCGDMSRLGATLSLKELSQTMEHPHGIRFKVGCSMQEMKSYGTINFVSFGGVGTRSYLEQRASLLGARTLLGAPGLTTRSKKLLETINTYK